MDNIRHHRIKFREYGEKLKDPAGGLKRLAGVRRVEIDTDAREVFVEYNLLKCTEAAIEKKMVEEGFVLDNSIAERLKRGWVHFTEENERDAMRAEPRPCCSVDEKKDEPESEIK
jgi:hypothetical protein